MRVGTFAALAAFYSVDAFTAIAPQRSSRAFSRSSLNMALSQDELKKQVGYKAVDDYVKSGMVVGLGTGSTAYFAVERVGQLLKSGELKDIICIPTSERTREQALSLGKLKLLRLVCSVLRCLLYSNLNLSLVCGGLC